MMPATYSFSLNLAKDRDIIDLMEGAKNKSALIRRSLHSLHREIVYEHYIEKLEKLCRTYCKELGWETPYFSQMLMASYASKEGEKLLIQPSLQESHNSSQEQE